MIQTLFHWFRTLVFYVLWIGFAIPWCTMIVFVVYFAPKHSRHKLFIKPFCAVSVYLCKWICGISWTLEGKENVPEHSCVVASNHQSPWETFFLQMMFAPQRTVVKKELLSIPFFGWALKRLNPIAINRNDRRASLKQVKEQGAQALSDNYWVVIYPEGTRYAWPEIGRFTRGAASLAQHAKKPVLPIVHNAGRLWPAFSFLKRPGNIVIKIGPVISSQDKSIPALTDEVRNWVEANQPQ